MSNDIWIRKQNYAGLIVAVRRAVIMVNSSLDTMESKWDYFGWIYESGYSVAPISIHNMIHESDVS